MTDELRATTEEEANRLMRAWQSTLSSAADALRLVLFDLDGAREKGPPEWLIPPSTAERQRLRAERDAYRTALLAANRRRAARGDRSPREEDEPSPEERRERARSIAYYYDDGQGFRAPSPASSEAPDVASPPANPGDDARDLVHAVRDVWLSARTNDDTPRGCYLVDSEPMLRAHAAMRAALAAPANRETGTPTIAWPFDGPLTDLLMAASTVRSMLDGAPLDPEFWREKLAAALVPFERALDAAPSPPGTWVDDGQGFRAPAAGVLAYARAIGPSEALSLKVNVHKCKEIRETTGCAGVSCPECPAAGAPSPGTAPGGDHNGSTKEGA